MKDTATRSADADAEDTDAAAAVAFTDEGQGPGRSLSSGSPGEKPEKRGDISPSPAAEETVEAVRQE